MSAVRGSPRRSGRALGIFMFSAAVAVVAIHPGTAMAVVGAAGVDTARLVTDTTDSNDVPDSLFGLSGKLRAKLVADPSVLEVGILARLFGAPAKDPGVYTLADSAAARPFSLITLFPFAAKTGSTVGTYRMGFWPSEKRPARSPAYGNPAGFIQVTRQNQDTYISEHFRLRDFLTKDQQSVWPKYLVLREPLLDKLELIINDLGKRGVRVARMTVMSGFRTPQYNEKGVGAGGRAADSRHQYGDAADVFVDNDGNGRMDDLNGDRRVDHRDAQVILDAAERVERAYPALVGGGGLYRATAAHGPFAHIDVRGSRARWGT